MIVRGCSNNYSFSDIMDEVMLTDPYAEIGKQEKVLPELIAQLSLLIILRVLFLLSSTFI